MKKSQTAVRGKRRILGGRLAYLLGVVCLFGYVVGFPPWVGNSYMPAWDNPETLQWNGTFGLRDSELNAPIWNPPHAHSPELNASVRWPWQSADSFAHVELSTFGIAWQIAFGMVLLGTGLRIWSWLSPGAKRDRFVDLAWSISLGIAISMLGLVIFGGFTAGYGLTDAVVLGGLSAGAILGLVYGAATFRPDRVGRSSLSVTQFAWFVSGLVVAVVIMVMAGNVASWFRGDPIGVTELGTSAYSGNQQLINLVTGIGIGLSGLFVSWVTARAKMPRGLVAGVFVGSVAIGILFAIWF